MAGRFKVTDYEIWNRFTDSHFRFSGLERNLDSIRSKEAIDIASIEEARSIKQEAMDVLFPTVRKSGSEIISSWNPLDPADPWDARYRGRNPPAGAIIQRVGIEDNPYFYRTRVAEYYRLKRQNELQWRHIYCGDYDTNPESRIFNNTKVGVIDPRDLDAYAPNYGIDFGFADDPTVITKTFVLDQFKTIYVQKEAYGYHVPNNDLAGLILAVVDDSDDLIIGDSSEQRTINYLQGEGFNVQPATKGPGSVKAGIRWLQGYRIIINPACRLLLAESRNYKWQINRLTGMRLSAPIDSDNHAWDSIRYGTEHLQLGGAAEDSDDIGMLDLVIDDKGFRLGNWSRGAQRGTVNAAS